MTTARWHPQTTLGASIPGAIAVFAVFGDENDVDGALARLGIPKMNPTQTSVRSIAGVDTGLIARPTARLALLMPHGGRAVERAIIAAFDAAGIPRSSGVHGDDALPDLFPDAADAVEAKMMSALGRAASPLAIGLLLDQPRRWRVIGDAPDSDRARRSSALNRLITPPTVVTWGPPNIGKSTLLNTLAKRTVARVADEPGTTRDHVGIMLNLAGLVVRFVDTPGIGPLDGLGASERAIQERARDLAGARAAEADLVILCADPGSSFVSPPPPHKHACGRAELRLGLRMDLGSAPEGADLCISARGQQGIIELVGCIRETLVAAADVDHPGPWRFW